MRDAPNLFKRKVRDSNPRYDVMRTPHFECGSFDHSDNFPRRNSLATRFVIRQKGRRGCSSPQKLKFSGSPRTSFLKSGCKITTNISYTQVFQRFSSKKVAYIIKK